MSVRVQTYVWQLALTPTQKLVAIALADHCHDDGSEARPSQDLLVKKTGLSVRTVRYTLKQLLELDVVRLARPAGQHKTNVYTFDLPEYFAKVRPANDDTSNPDRQMTTQTGNSPQPDRQRLPPNHKEPLVETDDGSISVDGAPVDLAEVRRRNDEILGRRRA